MANIMSMALKYKREYERLVRQDFDHFVSEQEDLWRGTNVQFTREAYEHQYEFVKLARRQTLKENIILRQARADMEWGWEFQYEFVQAKKRVAERLGIETEATRTFFITLRPDCNKVSFRDFYEKVLDIINRKTFLKYWLSFEQKGQSLDTLGHGFHVHIVAQTSFRSVPECARALTGKFDEDKKSYTHGSLSKWISQGKISAGCVDVQICKNPKEHVQRYLVDYESKDDHKQPTKEWDSMWREREGLSPLYTSDDPPDHLPIKSNRQVIFLVEEPKDA